MSYRLTILGCGPSGGVPRLGPNWGKCNPDNPRNRRRRCAVLIQRFSKAGVTNILVDTPPDIREQLLDAQISELHGVFFTHDHADHTHGIDDLRPVCFAMGRRVRVYADAATLESLTTRFSYCFASKQGSGYSAMLRGTELTPGERVRIDGPGGDINILPILQMHGVAASVGFRVGKLAYSPDISGLPQASESFLEGLDVWILDALRHAEHPSHFNVKQALARISTLKPKRAVLTHMTTELDYDALAKELPPNVEPAYDGMTIDFTD